MLRECRVCAATPFGRILGFGTIDEEQRTGNETNRTRRREVSSLLSQATSDDTEQQIRRASSEERTRFRRRTPEEVIIKVNAWISYLHNRAHQFWADPHSVEQILRDIAQSVDKETDPILGDETLCAFWHGDFNAEDLPVLRIMKPGESEESEAYVSRIIVFSFADDESFNILQQRGSEAFNMVCKEPSCINLNHISLD